MWAIVKRKLKGRRFADGDELFAAMSQAWGETSQEEIDHLCSSFNARCQVCIKHQGQSLNRHWHEVHAIHHAPGPI
jgi:hypothetical protein